MGWGNSKKKPDNVMFLQKPSRSESRNTTFVADTPGNQSQTDLQNRGQKLPKPVLKGFTDMFALYSQIHPDYPKEYTDEQWKRQIEIIKERVAKANQADARLKQREAEERKIIKKKRTEEKVKEDARIEKERKKIAEEQAILARVEQQMEEEEQKKVQAEHERKLKELQKEEEKRKIAEEVSRAADEERDRLQKAREEREVQERAEAEERLRHKTPPKRYSPEPPKVEFLEEDSYIELPPAIDQDKLREDRLEMEKNAEKLAKEIAEKKRIEEEEKLAKQEQEMAGMNDIAMSILSKYS